MVPRFTSKETPSTAFTGPPRPGKCFVRFLTLRRMSLPLIDPRASSSG
jgi:hypothetical protein